MRLSRVLRAGVRGTHLLMGCSRPLTSHPSSTSHLPNTILAVDKHDIHTSQIMETILQPLKENEIRLKVEKFALTSNTVTYGKIGTQFGYFNFYPFSPPSSSWGYVPAIGWATVVESSVEAIPLGGKYFGWYPMAQYCTVEAAPSKSGFRDIGKHRAENAAVYTEHIRTDMDPFRDSSISSSGFKEILDDYDDRQAILRGLFLTSFLADSYLRDELNYFGAKSIIIVSASSKTALGIAQRLANERKCRYHSQNNGDVFNVIGVTSDGNASFVRATGFYDQIVTYNSLSSICSDEDAVVIDMSGNWKVIQAIHQHLGDHIKHSMAIGLSHHDSGFAPKSLVIPGPAPTLFFAPFEVSRRLKEWGPTDFHNRCKEALSSFITGSKSWMNVSHVYGEAAVQREWLRVHDGQVSPNVGVMASMHHETNHHKKDIGNGQ